MPPEGAAESTTAVLASTKWHRKIFSFPAFLCFALMVLAVLTVQARFNDPDMWWHLRVGQVIWETGSIPQTDIFSFTTGKHAWTPHEWLGELSIYAAYKLAGYSGLMLWLCVSSSALLVLLYILCSVYSGNSKLSLAGAMTGWLFATVGLAVRPLLLGHLLLVVELLLLHLGDTRDRRWLLGLPLLFAVWVNTHSSYSLGLIVLGLVLVSSHLGFQLGSLSATPWRPEARKLFRWVCGFSVAALLANPGGARLLLYPLNVLTAQREALAAVDEWMPPTIADPRTIGLIVAASFFFLMVLLKRTSLYLNELLLLGLGFAMALQHSRMFFAFGILAAPAISRLLSNAWGSSERKRDHPILNAVLMAAGVIVMVFAFPDKASLEAQVKQDNPAGAVGYIRKAGLSGPMINDYTWGGYLIWALPEQKVFIDGRADVYEWTGVFHEYALWAMLQQDPKILLDKYKIGYCLLRKTAPLSVVLPYLPGWEQVYADAQAVIFARAKTIPSAS